MAYLSERLQTIADLLLEGLEVWDLCCDHGLLAEYALRTEKHPRVHLVDQVPEIMNRAQKRLFRFQHAHFWCVEAAQLQEPISGSLVIAGVGGKKILHILSELHSRKVLQARRLILSPHKDVLMIESFDGFGVWQKLDTKEVEERGKIRKIFVLDRNGP